MSDRPRLIIVRHGQTEWNADGRFQGTADIWLNEIGRAQAETVADELASVGATAVHTSSLMRAQQTAAPIAQRYGFTPVIDERLKEIDVGQWQGLDRAEAESRFPDEWAAWIAGEDVRRGGGETRAEAGQRGATALIHIMSEQTAGETTIVVSHGIVVQAAINYLVENELVAFAGPVPHLNNAAWLALP